MCGVRRVAMVDDDHKPGSVHALQTARQQGVLSRLLCMVLNPGGQVVSVVLEASLSLFKGLAARYALKQSTPTRSIAYWRLVPVASDTAYVTAL